MDEKLETSNSTKNQIVRMIEFNMKSLWDIDGTLLASTKTDCWCMLAAVVHVRLVSMNYWDANIAAHCTVENSSCTSGGCKPDTSNWKTHNENFLSESF